MPCVQAKERRRRMTLARRNRRVLKQTSLRQIMAKDTEANEDTTQKEAIEWLEKNEHLSFLGHGTQARHEWMVEYMRRIAKGE